MSKRVLFKSVVLLSVFVMLSVLMVAPARAAISFEGVTAWSWINETYIISVAVADVDDDGDAETITGGYYNDETRNVAQLCVWNGSTMALENVKAWCWADSTEITSVAVGDVDGDSSVEIVTGGYYANDTIPVYFAQLCVWDGATLALENVKAWYWTSYTEIHSVAVGDVDGDSEMEIVTGGYYNDGMYTNAQLCVWDGASLALENVMTWLWTESTTIRSVAIGDVDGDSSVEIVTGGTFYDTVRVNAQLCVWDGSTLALEDVTAWYWLGNTYLRSVAVGDVDADDSVEVVTGGIYYDGSRFVAQLCVWDGSTLAFENVKAWYWTSSTDVYSVIVADVDADEAAEIATVGSYFNGATYSAQLCVWSGSSLAVEDVTAWYWTSTTEIFSVAVADVDGDSSVEIVTGGYYLDGHSYAQLVVWIKA